MTGSSAHLRLVAGVMGCAWTVAVAPPVLAAPAPADTAVDVTIPEPRPPRRFIAVEWNPLPLVIGKLSANVVVVPVDHHGLVLSPFYAWTTTEPIYVFDDLGSATQLPQQKFSGFGGEIGYRYYTDRGGPRGLFAGPSVILGAMTATAQNGDRTSYLDWGVALDVGYELILADAVAVSLGGGVQYTMPDRSIPNQQFPADVYANSKLLPRALASIGWAF